MLRLLVALASILLAHGDTGRLELLDATPVDRTTVSYAVELTHAEDGNVIPQAEIIVVTDNVAPRAMTPLGEGRYEATIAFPAAGDYPVVFTVEEPAEAALVVEQVVEATTTTTTDEQVGTTTTAARTRDEVAEDEGGAWWLLIVMGAIVAAMVVVAVAYFRGRRQPSQ